MKMSIVTYEIKVLVIRNQVTGANATNVIKASGPYSDLQVFFNAPMKQTKWPNTQLLCNSIASLDFPRTCGV